MKKLVSYLSFTVVILAMFSFMNVGFSQGKAIKSKVTSKAEPQQVVQPAIEQPQVEPSTIETPTVDIQNTEVNQRPVSHSINVEFGYDFLANFKKLKNTEDGKTNIESFTSSDESAGYINLQFSFNFLVNPFEFGFGLGFILPKDYDNNIELEVPPANPKDTIKFKQELTLGVYAQLFKFGYTIDLGSVDLIPYARVNVLYLTAKDSLEFVEDDEKGTQDIKQLSIPIYGGLNVVFAKVDSLSFYAGLEVGYAIEVLFDTDVNDWGYHNSVGDRIADESKPLADLTGKVSLGASFNF